MKKEKEFVKVKLKLTQPALICSGRREVTCYYRGIIIEESDCEWVIQFKVHGQLVTESYDTIKKEFKSPQYRDVKIV